MRRKLKRYPIIPSSLSKCHIEPLTELSLDNLGAVSRVLFDISEGWIGLQLLMRVGRGRGANCVSLVLSCLIGSAPYALHISSSFAALWCAALSIDALLPSVLQPRTRSTGGKFLILLCSRFSHLKLCNADDAKISTNRRVQSFTPSVGLLFAVSIVTCMLY